MDLINIFIIIITGERLNPALIQVLRGCDSQVL